MNVIVCNKGVTDIVVNLPSRVIVNDLFKVTAHSVPEGSTVTFQSSDSEIAKIIPDTNACGCQCCDSSCYVQAISEGSFYLTMVSGDLKKSVEIVVNSDSESGGDDPEPTGNYLKFDFSSMILRKGESRLITYKVKPNDAYLTWHSERPGIATVNANGIVTGVMKGTTRVYATTNGLEASCYVYVNELGIQDQIYEVCMGKSIQIPVSTLDGFPVYWSTSDELIASVNNQGIITGNYVGDAIISVTAVTSSGPITQPIRVKVVNYFTPINDLKLVDIHKLKIYDSDEALRLDNVGVNIKVLPEGPLVPKLYYVKIDGNDDIYHYKLCAVQSDIDKFLLRTTNKDI